MNIVLKSWDLRIYLFSINWFVVRNNPHQEMTNLSILYPFTLRVKWYKYTFFLKQIQN